MLSRYRPEIDGLRAISVFMIIIYHAKISINNKHILAGGYIGVDIFLVISGYLITSIILKEALSKNGFSFSKFYYKRIKRLLPALLFVLILSIPFALMCLLPRDLLDFTNSLFSTLFFFSNFFFYFEGQQYGASETLLLPLQHMWSLSLEEQFYLIFPIFLLKIFKLIKANLEVTLVFCLFVSLATAHWEATNLSSSSYYFLHTRLWELIAGALIAVIELRYSKKSKYYLIQNTAPFFGILLIILGVILAGKETQHPSLYTTIPVFGTCLILFFNDKQNLITRILSIRFLIWFGVLSYSLYLWHFPLFAFYRIYFAGNDSLLFRVILAFVLIFLSAITYFLVEKPFRKNMLNVRSTLLFLFAAYLFLISFIVCSIFTKGFEYRVPKELRDKIERTNYYSSIYKTCHLGSGNNGNAFCSFGDFQKQIVLVGDSHAGVLLNDLKLKTRKNEYKLVTMTRNAEKLKFTNMSEYALERYKRLIQIKNSIVVIDGNYNQPDKLFNFEAQIYHFNKFLTQMANNNNHIIFITPNPQIENPYSSLMNGMRYVRLYKKVGISDFKSLRDKHITSMTSFSNFFEKASLQFKHITLLDTSNIFCDENYCYSIKDGNLLLFDDSHTSDFSAKKINDMIIKKANEIYLDLLSN